MLLGLRIHWLYQPEADSYPVSVGNDRERGVCIVWALEIFRDIVLGHHITVYCDHNPLQYIKDSATKSAKLLRWSLALAEYDLEMKYTAGQ